MVSVPELPLLTVKAPDVAPIVKSDDVVEVTVRPTVVVSVVPSEVFPVTVTGKFRCGGRAGRKRQDRAS